MLAEAGRAPRLSAQFLAEAVSKPVQIDPDSARDALREPARRMPTIPRWPTSVCRLSNRLDQADGWVLAGRASICRPAKIGK